MEPLKYYIKKVFRRKYRNELRDLNALIELNALLDIYVPWSKSGISPRHLKIILNDIAVNNRSVIVECGSGISTLYIASLLKQNSIKNGKIYSIDHNKEWIDVLRHYLNVLDIRNFVELIHAPLKLFDHNFKAVSWYDSNILKDKTDEISIDQLIVDGPPAYKNDIQYSRFPAVPFFEDKFSKNYSVFLDDTDRKAEKQILKTWSEILGIEYHHLKNDDSLAFMRKGKSFVIS